MEPLISVIVPIYNVEPYLRQCVDSIINQTYRNLEIILVDDGSPDNCGAICDEYAEKDNRVVVIHKENGGLSDARNAGLKVMHGEYLMFVDSDDYIETGFLKKCMPDYEFDLAVAGCTIFYENKQNEKRIATTRDSFFVENKLDFGEMYYLVEHSIFGYAWAKIYNKQIIENLRMENILFREDLFFNMAAWKNATKIFVSSETGYFYRQRENSELHSKFNKPIPNITQIATRMIVNFSCYSRKENRTLSNMLIRTYLIDAIYKCILQNENLTENEKTKKIKEVFFDSTLRNAISISFQSKLEFLITVTYKLNLPMIYYHILKEIV